MSISASRAPVPARRPVRTLQPYGGRLIFLAVELVSRRPVPRKFEAVVHAVGFVLFLGLVLVISGQEIWALLAN